MTALSDVLRPAIKKVLLARVVHLVKQGRSTDAKAQIIWGHSFDYLDERETADLIHQFELEAA